MINKIDTQKVIELYSDRNSITQISNILGIGYRRVRKCLVDNNIQIRHNDFYRSKIVNENFFNKIDTEEKAYILGFIYADGCLTKGKILKISVTEDDNEILYKIREALGSSHTIGTYESHNGYKTKNRYSSLSISSRHLHDSLVECGATERKTKTLKFPDCNILPERLYNHFIRGFFDGDGSVYYVKQSNTVGCSFTGTKNMLDKIQMILYNITGSKSVVHKYKNKDIYDFKVGGRNKAKLFYDYIYKDATIFLGRKKSLFDKYLR